ncbi:MAG: DAK2 domain-containing protein [Actinomycetota bacterium]|nr:DAK2 domain-containing protein [Actinomycetota bacterium]
MEALAVMSAGDVAGALRAFGSALRDHRAALNALNVYPVPDGDTGTNMALTVQAVLAELDERGAEPVMADVCQAASHGSLMGARGNSGVILSQLLRGLAKVLGQQETVTGGQMARALRSASRAADEAVLRPVEGTILSVARAAAEGAERVVGAEPSGTEPSGTEPSGTEPSGTEPSGTEPSGTEPSGTEPSGTPATDDVTLLTVLQAARDAAAEALARTPEQLPVLARAGVVDAGGSGFLLFIDAFLHVVDGRTIPPLRLAGGARLPTELGAQPPVPPDAGGDIGGQGGPRYEVMYLLEASDETIGALKEVWAGLGDSIVVVGGDGLWNCHIHTDEVGPAIEAALDGGRPRDIRVTDLREQVDEVRWVREHVARVADEPSGGPPRRTAVVAVASGEGIRRIFRSLGVRQFVSGGQSLNPSTAQILEALAEVEAPEVVLLPNNDNIHPVARQVCELADRPVHVVPTGSIVEGFAALLEYDPEASAADNASSMAASARQVVAGEVVQAVRDAEGPDGPVRTGDWLGLSSHGIEVVGDSVVSATTSLVDKLLGDDHELVTLIEGEGAGAGDTRRVTEWLAERYPDVAVEVHHGGQPLYPYLLSIE